MYFIRCLSVHSGHSFLKAYTAMFMVLNGHYGGSLSALFCEGFNFETFTLNSRCGWLAGWLAVCAQLAFFFGST